MHYTYMNELPIPVYHASRMQFMIINLIGTTVSHTFPLLEVKMNITFLKTHFQRTLTN